MIKDQFNILTLDGGGAKGFYSLGVLHEVEAALGGSIADNFNLIYGTSTGSIIAAMLSVGKSVKEIHRVYREHVPKIMGAFGSSNKSSALQKAGQKVFGDLRFDDTKTSLGIVATKWKSESAMIFKSNIEMAHGRKASYDPGFGCTLAEAIQASCSAYPYFKTSTVSPSVGGDIELFDGGFIANNPTMFALVDATSAMKVERSSCRVLSVGCGNFPEPCLSFKNYFSVTKLLFKTLESNTNSMDKLRQLVFNDVPTVRIDETFSRQEMATDMFEHDPKKLSQLFHCGRDSFVKQEKQFRDLFLP